MRGQQTRRRGERAVTVGLWLVLGGACAAEEKPEEFATSDDGAATVPVDHSVAGPFGVRHELHELTVGERVLPVSLWLPAESATGASDIVDLLGGDEAEAWRLLLEEAPEGCPSETVDADGEAPVAEGGPWPLVVVSHCHECTRASKATISARLASHGIASLAPDHVGNTLWDAGTDEALPLTAETLAVREADMVAVLDAALDDGFGVAFDAEAVGALGHSFGSVTVGRLAQDDARIQAAAGLAAPMENPLLPGVDMAQITVPLLLLEAEEDNSITEVGNQLIVANADAALGPVDLVRVADAGHWSVSDLCGLVDAFSAGCGTAPRQTDPDQTVDYPAPDGIRAGTATVVTAFFAEQLTGDSGALDRVPLPSGFSVEAR